MMPIQLFIILLIGQLIGALETSSKPARFTEKIVELQILFPNGKMETTSGCLKVQVLFINHTDTVTSFFEDWNSFGYFNIHFELKTANKSFFLEKGVKQWDKNFPSYKALFPGDTMVLTYSLNHDLCYLSEFSGIIPLPSAGSSTIRAIYQLSRETLEEAHLQGEIKYKSIYKRLGTRNRGEGERIIVDSLKYPVEINRTFPLTELQSKTYELE
jgi:hypothetical protein